MARTAEQSRDSQDCCSWREHHQDQSPGVLHTKRTDLPQGEHEHRERFHLKRWLGYKQHHNSPQGSTVKSCEKIQMLEGPEVSYSD